MPQVFKGLTISWTPVFIPGGYICEPILYMCTYCLSAPSNWVTDSLCPISSITVMHSTDSGPTAVSSFDCNSSDKNNENVTEM